MQYRYAKKLHNEDEVTIKKTGEIRTVIETVDYFKEKFVLITLNDGNTYHHTEIK